MSSRTNLIMHFHCSECGNQLTIDYPKEAKTPPVDNWGAPQTPKEDTGAACFYTPKISIAPCRHCIEKHTAPARKLVEAVRDMQL